MPETKNNFKSKESENEEIDFTAKKRHNNINRFLNYYFKYFLVFLLCIFLIIVIVFFIKPRFEKAVVTSNDILQKQKTEFIQKYQDLENYKELIAGFENVNPDITYKINKIIPTAYTRDDLFTEITYFLISNDFKVDNVEVISLEKNETNIPAETGVNLGRRVENTKKVDSSDTGTTSDLYLKQLNSLPSTIGAWVVKVSISDIDYSKLKKLFNVLENNLRLIDIYYLDFQPESRSVNIEFLTYYKK